jgi:hypothetical protein
MELPNINILFACLFVGILVVKIWIERKYNTIIPTVVLVSAFALFTGYQLLISFSVNKLLLWLILIGLIFYIYFKKKVLKK